MAPRHTLAATPHDSDLTHRHTKLAPSPSLASPTRIESVATWTPCTPTASSFPLPPSFSSHPTPTMADVHQSSGEATSAGTRLALQTGIDWAAYRSSSSESSAGESDTDEVTTPDEAEYEFQDDLFLRRREPRATSTSVLNTDAFALALPLPPRLAPRKSTPNLYPTFGDWLPEQFPATGKPGFDEADAVTRLALGKGPGVVGEQDTIGLGLTLDTRVQHVAHAVADAESDGGAQFATSPFTPFESEDNTFTFFPSNSFRNSAASSPPASTSTLHPSSAMHTPTKQMHFPLTPPRSRSGTPNCHPNPGPSSLPPTPPGVLSLPLRPLPPPFVPAHAAVAAQDAVDDYPLSEADTALLASLHEGRIPTLQQLAPSDGPDGSGVQPIVNTGNHGPMVIQTGDWKCGACTFVNWRRRKICMRCFPFANDIGNLLTIQGGHTSHRPSSYAGPPSPSYPPTQYSHSYSPPSAIQSHKHQQRVNSLPVYYQSYPSSQPSTSPQRFTAPGPYFHVPQPTFHQVPASQWAEAHSSQVFARRAQAQSILFHPSLGM